MMYRVPIDKLLSPLPKVYDLRKFIYALAGMDGIVISAHISVFISLRVNLRNDYACPSSVKLGNLYALEGAVA